MNQSDMPQTFERRPQKNREGSGMGVIDEVKAERERQQDAEGWSLEHDDKHRLGEIADAAACYAATKPIYCVAHACDEVALGGFRFSTVWRWETRWWKPKGRRRNLVRAAALLVAEIERLDRAALETKEGT